MVRNTYERDQEERERQSAQVATELQKIEDWCKNLRKGEKVILANLMADENSFIQGLHAYRIKQSTAKTNRHVRDAWNWFHNLQSKHQNELLGWLASDLDEKILHVFTLFCAQEKK